MHDVEDRGVPYLDVADAVLGRVFGQLVRYSLERLLGLHHGDRDIEAAQVILEGLGVVHPHEFRQLLGSVPRHLNARLARQVEQSRGPNGAVEMAVELRFRKLAELAGENR